MCSSIRLDIQLLDHCIWRFTCFFWLMSRKTFYKIALNVLCRTDSTRTVALSGNLSKDVKVLCRDHPKVVFQGLLLLVITLFFFNLKKTNAFCSCALLDLILLPPVWGDNTVPMREVLCGLLVRVLTLQDFFFSSQPNSAKWYYWLLHPWFAFLYLSWYFAWSYWLNDLLSVCLCLSRHHTSPRPSPSRPSCPFTDLRSN